MSAQVKRGTYRRSCRTCGWSGEYSTAGRGDYAKKRHDCARQKAYGRWDNLVDAGPARAHVRSLMNQGMGLKRIVAVSDISQGLLWKLVYGKRRPDGSRTPSKRIRKDTEARILAIELDLAAGAVLDGTETITRLRSLVAIGWSMSKLCARLGIDNGNFTPIIHGRRRLTVATVKTADALFEELSMTLPPRESHRDKIAYSRAINYAARQGWVAPLDLEDLADHDDRSLLELVAAGPVIDEAAVWRAVNGDRAVDLTAADRHQVVRVLHGRGLTDRQVGELTGFKDPATMRKRLGLPTNRGDRIDWSEYGERPHRRTEVAS